MTPATQPFREEHQRLLRHIEELRSVADGLRGTPTEVVTREVGLIHDFLTHHLIPQTAAEERILYPFVGKLLGSLDATATMSLDHQEVVRLTNELGTLHTELVAGFVTMPHLQELERILYELHELLTTHFAKEEEVYLPLLDKHLTHTEARDLFARMEEIAGPGAATRV